MGQNGLTARNRGRTLYLHIGIPKTATTWLQTKVFTHLDHLLYLNCPESYLFNTNNQQVPDRYLGKIFRLSPQVWTEYGDTILEGLLGPQEKWLEDSRDILISEEDIGRWGSRPVLFSAHIRKLKKKALEWGFGQISIIYIIRRQDYWLASHYAQMSDQNPNAGQADFRKFIQEITAPHLSRYGFGMLLDYNVMYSSLTKLLEKDNVLILPYELLKESPHSFLKNLLQEVGTPVYKIKNINKLTSGTKANVRSDSDNFTWQLRPPRKQEWNKKIISRFLKTSRPAIKMNTELSQSIINIYAPGNHRLAQDLNLDLARYGYY